MKIPIEILEAAPAVMIGVVGSLVRFAYDVEVSRKFSITRLLAGLVVATFVVWTVAYLIDILGFSLSAQEKQLVYCWAGYTSRDLAYILSKRFLKIVKASTGGK